MNRESVSPVIATILMVAITVVLAAVLYVLVTQFVIDPEPPVTMGVIVSRENSGNYTVKIISPPTGLTESQLTLSAIRGGTVLIGKVPVTSLSCATQGAQWVQLDPSSSTVTAGDFVALVGVGNGCPGTPGNEFQVGDSLELGRGGKILWSGGIN